MAGLRACAAALAADMSPDRSFASSDVGFWLHQVFFLPGDYGVRLLLTRAPDAARFLGLGPEDYGGVLSGVLSGAVWLACLITLGAGYRLVSALDRAVTASAIQLGSGAARRARAARTWTLSQSHRLKHSARRASPDDSSRVEVHELGTLELRMLLCYARLKPGYVLTASDSARALGVRRADARRALDSLGKLQLVSRSFASCDGEDGYALTRAGEAFLRARRASANPAAHAAARR